MQLFDAHLDLAMNAVEWNRDYSRPLADVRRDEAHLTDKRDRGRGTVTLPELRRAEVRLCVATLIARVEMNAWSPVAGWRSQAQAWAITEAQLAWYRAMEEAGKMRCIRSRSDLDVQSDALGYVLSLEGADSLVSLAHLERRYAAGLRAIGPAHYGPGVYAHGTDAEGGLPARGRDLLKEMDRLGMILDSTHLNDECFWDALEIFQGPVWASHQNCRVLAPWNRQFADDQIKAVVERGGVLGMAFDAIMMVPGWIHNRSKPSDFNLKIERICEHIDHICQLAGSAKHVGIGTDLDGGYGNEQTPLDMNSIYDLQTIPGLLKKRGYKKAEIEGIMSGNFLNFLRKNLPA